MKFLFLLGSVLFWGCAWGIRCHSGALFQTPAFSSNAFPEEDCPPDFQYCIRGNGFVETALPFNVNVEAIGLCANQTVCNDSCTELGNIVVDRFILGGDVPLPVSPGSLNTIFNITSCESICCETDLCNAFTVDEIRMGVHTGISTTTTTTTTTTTMGAESVVVNRKIVFFLSFVTFLVSVVY